MGRDFCMHKKKKIKTLETNGSDCQRRGQGLSCPTHGKGARSGRHLKSGKDLSRLD